MRSTGPRRGRLSASGAWARLLHVISGAGFVAAKAFHVRQGNVGLALPDRHPGRAFLIGAPGTERP
jgi:hypothetical protein